LIQVQAPVMHIGKLVFSQVIDSLPMHAFRRGITRYDGNRYKKTFSNTCA